MDVTKAKVTRITIVKSELEKLTAEAPFDPLAPRKIPRLLRDVLDAGIEVVITDTEGQPITKLEFHNGKLWSEPCDSLTKRVKSS